jgi:hypothetical protein
MKVLSILLVKLFFQVSKTLSNHVATWKDCILPSLWVPPAVGWIKANFDGSKTLLRSGCGCP